jgi:NADH:ubiquinone oxidoreductase subunit 4 (subunit M)
LYERIHSRSLIIVKGSNITLIGLRIWFFILVCSNISAPPTLNFFSELSLLFGVSFYLIYILPFFLIIMFLGTICSFHLFVSIFHGFRKIIYSFSSLSIKEHLILITHSFPIFLIFSIF